MNNSYHLQLTVGSQLYEADLTPTDRSELTSLVIAGRGYAIAGNDTVSSLVNERLSKLPSREFETVDTFRAVLLKGTCEVQKIQKIAIEQIGSKEILSDREIESARPLEDKSIEKVALSCISSTKLNEKKPTTHSWGEVIVLVGGSSVGKSSIISEILNRRNDFIEDGGDLAGDRIPRQYLEKKFPEEFALFQRMIDLDKISSIYLTETGKIINEVLSEKPMKYFKDEITGEETETFYEIREKLREALTSYLPPGIEPLKIKMMDDILENSKGGRSVVFDALQVEEVVAHALGKEHPSLKLALVYCPFQTLAKRVVNRNKEAVEENKYWDARPGVFPLTHFTKLFRPLRSDEEEVIQTLSRKDAEAAIDLLLADELDYVTRYESDSLTERDLKKEGAESKTEILRALGFSDTDDDEKVVELTPTFKGYQIIVNTASNKNKQESVRNSVDAIFKY